VLLVVLLTGGGFTSGPSRNILWTIAVILLLLWLFGALR
jgi:hypothetical protein